MRNGSNGRDGRGRFAVGNLGGPGNPFARRTAQLRQALVEAVSVDDIKDVAAMLLMKAKQGDVAAAKVLLAYVVGKPAEMRDPDRLDHEEFEQWHENTVDNEKMEQVIEGTPVQVVTELFRYVVPCKAETARQQAAAMLRAEDEAKARPQDKRTTKAAPGRAPMTNGTNGKSAGAEHTAPAVNGQARVRKSGKPPVAHVDGTRRALAPGKAPMANGRNGKSAG